MNTLNQFFLMIFIGDYLNNNLAIQSLQYLMSMNYLPGKLIDYHSASQPQDLDYVIDVIDSMKYHCNLDMQEQNEEQIMQIENDPLVKAIEEEAKAQINVSTGEGASSQDLQEPDYFSLPNFQLLQPSSSQNSRELSLKNKLKSAKKHKKYPKKPETQRKTPKPKKVHQTLTKIKGYPTKNFLPNFKAPHLNFLTKYYGETYLNNLSLIRRINAKNGMNLDDYKELYTTPQLQAGLKEMFRTKYLYRQMMPSRSCSGSKRVHQGKIIIFERGFTTKILKKIN